tara:strand:- start:17154 stop:17318 length:165 start_codon:yes stop_codon:yes gene_type:complete
MEINMVSKVIDYSISQVKLDNLKKALTDSKVEYMITRQEGAVMHINAWVGEETC